ncbi:MAG: hypothetical protein JO305_03090 [Alphaproteobacteria bacterium]|nr:hypothetical protein [Alphaproteobacteria bacterium]
MPFRLLMAISFLAAAAAAWIPAGPLNGQPVQGRSASCDPTDFTGRVSLLHSSSAQLTPQMIQDLGDAYCHAPEIFRHRLDGIDFIFVDATACRGGKLDQCDAGAGDQAAVQSWGQRDAWGYTEIGIPAGLWPPNQNAEPYDKYEAEMLNYLVGWSDHDSPLGFAPPAGSVATTPWMTVLAALAHEAGHVVWFEVNARGGYGRAYDFKRLNDCSFFLGWRDQDPKALSRADRWRPFGDRSTEAGNEHANPPTFSADYAGATTDALRAALLAQLFASGQPWASYLGANAPDEDFVETYKFAILVDAGLASMPITLQFADGTSSASDIAADFLAGRKQDLASKVKCLRRWI